LVVLAQRREKQFSLKAENRAFPFPHSSNRGDVLLGVATEGGMFNLELFVLFVKRVYGSVEILQVFLILAHHVFGKVQEFLRGWSAGMHGAKYTPGERVKIAGVSSGLMA
jgi:hypothetical protein